MILISHRGNLTGINSEKENHPIYIKNALNQGYNCEIDVWYKDNHWWLGHDKPQYKITYKWLINHSYGLWVHCKNLPAIYKLSLRKNGHILNNCINYFWHENDTVTLTSKGIIWAYPTKNPIINSIAVLPEKYNTNISKCYGVCSDFITNYKNT